MTRFLKLRSTRASLAVLGPALFAASFSVVAQPTFASALSNGAETAIPRSADSKDMTGAIIVAQAYDSFRPKPDRSDKPDRPPKPDRGAAGMQDYHTPRGAIEADRPDRPPRRERGATGGQSKILPYMERQANPTPGGIIANEPRSNNRRGRATPMPQGIVTPTDRPRGIGPIEQPR
jgi:hypothetical protein